MGSGLGVVVGSGILAFDCEFGLRSNCSFFKYSALAGLALLVGGTIAWVIASDPPSPSFDDEDLYEGDLDALARSPRKADVALYFSVMATRKARNGQCDEVIKLVEQVRTLDPIAHTRLTTKVEIKRCLLAPRLSQPNSTNAPQ